VSTGLFAVMQAVALKRGDVVITTDVRYHSVEDTLQHLCACAGATLHTVRLPMPAASQEELAQAWREGLAAAASKGRVQLAVMDWVSSKPSMLFPIRAMVAACAAAGVPTLVDGAHVPGSVPEAEIALDELGCDFFCCTFSKWLFAPRSIAALYVREGSHLRWPHVDCARLDPQVVPVGAASTDETTYVADNLTKGIYDESTRSRSPPAKDDRLMYCCIVVGIMGMRLFFRCVLRSGEDTLWSCWGVRR
jgi:hypothetical protein